VIFVLDFVLLITCMLSSYTALVWPSMVSDYHMYSSSDLEPSCSSSTLQIWCCLQGTAMASLVHMQRILANRQLHFPSVEKAVRS